MILTSQPVSVPSATPWSAAFAGAAALFSFLSVVVARLNYAEDELRRQNRIENRVLNDGRRLTYDRPPKGRNSGLTAFSASPLEDSEPEYRFRVRDVLVHEKRGWRYLINKAVHGFDGEVFVEIQADRWSKMVGMWNAETPPDFEKIAEFDFEGYDMRCELYSEDALLVIRSPSADVDRVSDAVDGLMEYVEEELGDELVPWEG